MPINSRRIGDLIFVDDEQNGVPVIKIVDANTKRMLVWVNHPGCVSLQKWLTERAAKYLRNIGTPK